jgi:prepilin-type N-terminal cleavage/methylation domain-containing protein/prepilin-type processing-associated H-X9-DG protein
MRRKGFTLIELLVVMVILAILAAVLFPIYLNFKESANATADLSQLRQVTMAMLQYTANHEDTWPYHKVRENPSRLMSEATHPGIVYGWPCLVLPYAKSKESFISPADKHNKGYQKEQLRRFNNEAYVFGFFPSWGYNFAYFAPEVSPRVERNGNVPIKGTQVQQPSSTLVLASSIYEGRPQDGRDIQRKEIGYYKVHAPYDGNPNLKDYSTYWIHKGQLFKSRPLSERGPKSYGCLWPRLKGHTFCNVAFADGHVKGMDIDQLIQDEQIWKIQKD